MESEDPIKWQENNLEITDFIGVIAICFRATKEYKSKHMKNSDACLSGEIEDLSFDDILWQNGNGVAHVVDDRDPKKIKKLRELNEKSSTSGAALQGGIGHEVYSSWMISKITELLKKSFVDTKTTYFDEVIADILTKEPDLLKFEPYLVKKPK